MRARVLLIVICFAVGCFCLYHMDKSYDPLARYPYTTDANRDIILEYLDSNDIYLHSDIHGAPSISIRLKGKELTDQSIKEAGIFAASYSSAWANGYSNQDVYYVSPDQVSKTPESGEYVSKGSFIIRGHRNYIRNARLELAVGIVDYEGKRIMAGPIEAVNQYTDNYIALKPGHIKKEAIAKKIKWFVENREQVSLMGKKAAKHAENYSWDNYSETIIKQLRSISKDIKTVSFTNNQ